MENNSKVEQHRTADIERQFTAGLWRAAQSAADDNGKAKKPIKEIVSHFLKRKVCQGRDEMDCEIQLLEAVELATAAVKFRAEQMGADIQDTAQKYRMLLQFASSIDEKYPTAPPTMKMAACKWVESVWPPANSQQISIHA